MKVERETKVTLSSADFEHLLSLSDVRKCTDQLNVYYDYRGILASKMVTCRVRLTMGSHPMMTVKLPGHWDGARREALELESEIRDTRLVPRPCLDVHRDAPSEVATCLEGLGLAYLERVGWMRNRRWKVSLLGLEFELDRTALPDGSVFFEAEIEADDIDVHSRLLAFLKEHASSAQPSRVSKFQRFLEASSRRTRTAST